MDMIAAARRLSSLGLATHWLRPPPRTPCPWPAQPCQSGGTVARCSCPGKAPIARGWQTAPYLPPDKVGAGYKPGANLGVHCGLVLGAPCSVVVIDLDSAEAIEWADAHLPKTPWRTLTGKGEHWFYRHPGAGHVLPNKAHVVTPQGLRLALDLRGDGGQVVVAPSVHPSGRAYAEAEPWQHAELPCFEAPWIAAPPRATAKRSAAPRKQDASLIERRARSYLLGMPAGVSGQGGHGATLQAAAALTRGFGLDEGTALALLREFNLRCEPPWSDDDLRRKVSESLKLSRLPADGWLRDAESPRYQPRAHGTEQAGPAWWPEVPDAANTPPARPPLRLGSRPDQERDEAIAAIAARGSGVYVRGGALVDVLGSPPRIRPMPLHHLRAELAGTVQCMQYERRAQEWREVPPPLDLARTVLDARDWPGVRELKGIAEAPCLRPDGSVLDSPGYDAQTGLWLAQSLPLQVPAQPSAADVRRAIESLLDVVCDFPFAHEAGSSTWLAGLLTMAASPAIDGRRPAWIVDANTPGSGKGLIVQAAAVIALGRELAHTDQGKGPEDDTKTLVSLALQGATVVWWDNITRPFGSGPVDAAITSGAIQSRILGKSEAPRLPFDPVHWITGNNIRLHGDFARRSIRLRLLSQDEHPERRSGFRHAPLLPWVHQERSRLLGAALTLLRAYQLAGRPGRPPLLGSFEQWSALVRGCLMWCDLPDPLAGAQEDQEDADESVEVLPLLLAGWTDLCQELPRPPGEAPWASTAEAVHRLSVRTEGGFAYPLPRLRAALQEICGPELPDVRRLGALLKRYRDRVVGGSRLVRTRTNSAKGWAVVTSAEVTVTSAQNAEVTE